MATVTQPKTFNHEETQRRVKHPLQQVRSYIRTYIILEGIALTLLCGSLLFWLGLGFDFGLFKFYVPAINIFGVDWIMEFNDIDSSGISSLGCRVMMLTIIVVGLIALGFSKVVLRWLREFNDRAIALVLERRFPKELGDRLITAVELADPKLSKKYGYSQAMVEKTIMEAVATIKKLPVASVFNWKRLFGVWVLLGFSTIGMLIATMAVFCLGSLFTEKPMSPYGFAWRFYDVGAIWTERNIFMMNTYWPRDAYLEIGRFQPSKNDANDMRVARDDDRPELQVRAIEFVIADRKAPHGWRALTWKDLSERKLIDQSLLDAVKTPTDFKYFQVDTDELEPNLVAALFGAGTEVRSSIRSSGELRAHFRQANVKKKIEDRGVQGALDEWLDWKSWTVDKFGLQRDNLAQRDPMVVQPALAASTVALLGSALEGNGALAAAAAVSFPGRTEQMTEYAPVEAVFQELDKIVEYPSNSRTIRKLTIPRFVHVKFRGKETGGTSGGGFAWEEGNKYTVALKGLGHPDTSSHYTFRARGEDYFTPIKVITLVNAPMPASIAIDKEEPAYTYLRMAGEDQMPLAGRKHYTKGFALSTTGDTNSIEVPIGAKLVIHVKMPRSENPGKDDDGSDRKLRAELPVLTREPPTLDPAFDLFRGKVVPDEDRYGFSLVMDNVTRNHDFLVEFFDEDNIRGKRRFKVMRTLDADPHVGNLAVFGYSPRKPRFKQPTVGEKDAKDPKDKDKDGAQPSRDQAELTGAYLITPDAYIPLECKVADDYGLVKVGYHYKYRKVDFELISQGGSKKLPSLQIGTETRKFHALLVAENFEFWPGNPFSYHLAPFFIAHRADAILTDIRVAQGYKEGFVGAPAFGELLKRRGGDMITLEDLEKGLSGRRAARGWEFDFKEDAGFDLSRFTPKLKAGPLDEIGQMHYHLQIAVQATDNNVETGADFPIEIEEKVGGTLVKKTIMQKGNTKKNSNGYLNFVVVSENELLAQIALEEEILNEKLESAKEKVDAGMVSLLEQQSKTRSTKGDDMESILNRMNEIRTALGTSGNILREAHQAYDNIAKEMKFNRVDPSRIKKIDETIIARLEDIVAQDPPGSYVRAETAFQKAHQLVEDEANAKRDPNIAVHQTNMLDAHRHMDNLSRDIKLLLDAMSEGILESKLIALIDSIERKQRENSRILHNWKTEAELKLIEDLLKGQDKDKKEKKDDKKTPDKTSRLSTPAANQLDRPADWDFAMVQGASWRDRPLVLEIRMQPAELRASPNVPPGQAVRRESRHRTANFNL